MRMSPETVDASTSLFNPLISISPSRLSALRPTPSGTNNTRSTWSRVSRSVAAPATGETYSTTISSPSSVWVLRTSRAGRVSSSFCTVESSSTWFS